MPAHTMLDIDRFMSKTARDPATGCLLWTAARLDQGYGVFSVRHKTCRAHKWILERKLGRPLRPGMHACHTCDNPPCVDSHHLYEGTPLQNAADAVSRDRMQRGSRNGMSKLTDESAQRIRDLVGTGATQRQVAYSFGVHPSQVSRIVRGKRWVARSVGGE